MDFDEIVESVGRGVEAAGVAAIVLGIAVATVRYGTHLRRNLDASQAYRLYRQGLGRALLLGLNLVVAAAIIGTVATSLTHHGAGILAGVVLIRPFLSFALELAFLGRWPWQPRKAIISVITAS